MQLDNAAKMRLNPYSIGPCSPRAEMLNRCLLERCDNIYTYFNLLRRKKCTLSSANIR